jgi:hypothetical protein
MDQLFQALPTDLQWEILSEFVGSHSVRNGKLIKKIVFDERHQMLENMARIRTTWDPPLILEVIPISFVLFSNGTQLMFTYHPGYGTLGYMFISNKREWTRLDIITGTHWTGTPPYEKHVYPSYEYTDKKKKKYNQTNL